MRKTAALILFCMLFLFSFVVDLTAQGMDELLEEHRTLLHCKLLIEQDGDTLWESESEKAVILGRPVRMNIRSDKMLAIAHITLYPDKNDQWVVIAQAEVWYADATMNFSQYYQAAESFTVKEGKLLVFYPFRKRKKGEADMAELKLEISIEHDD